MSNASLARPQILSLDEAESILSPHLDRLNRCIQHGWDAWTTEYAFKHHILSARARSAIVFDEIVSRALEEFAGIPNVKPARSHSTFMLYIGDEITLRFKKIRKNGRCSNIQTKQQVLFLAQAQLKLPNMLDGTLVHAGYTLDDLQQEISRKAVVCQLYNRVLWQISLSSETKAVVEIASTPVTTEFSSRFEPKPELVKAVPATKKKANKE